jgi:hypothetical protein
MKRQEEINTHRMSNSYLNSSLNPSLPERYILMFPNPNPNLTRIEVIKLDRTGKYVLKLPHASRNKDRKLDQNQKKTNTNQNLDQNLGNKDLQDLEGWKTRDGKADQVSERNRIFRQRKKKILLMK